MLYPKEERLEHLNIHIEAFNNIEHTNFRERAAAANDIAQNAFKHVYQDFEAVEANNAEKVPKNIQKVFEKEGITNYRFNDETNEIEFEFKDLDQLKRVAKNAKRQVHITKLDAENHTRDENHGGAPGSDKPSGAGNPDPKAMEKNQYSGTAWLTDDSVDDSQRRKEIERATGAFKEILLWSHQHPEESAEKMNQALEKGVKYVDMPQEELKEETNFKNMDDLRNEQLEHRIEQLVQDNWGQVHEAIDRSAADQPDEAESFRIASDAMQEAYAESILENFQIDQDLNNSSDSSRRSTANYDSSVFEMEESAADMPSAIAEGRAIVDSAQYGQEAEVEFTREHLHSIEQFQDIHDRASNYIASNSATELSTRDEAIRKVTEQLEAGINYINQNESAIQSGDQYDDGSLNLFYEQAANQARTDERQLVLPACCLTEECYRNFSTRSPLQPGPVLVVYWVLPSLRRAKHKRGSWP